jgi:aspartate aminotransferase
MDFSKNIARLQPSATIAVSTLAKKLASEGRDIIDLSAGEPDFPTPAWIAEAGVTSIQEGRTGYTPAPGLPALRKAVAENLSVTAAPGWSLSPEGVVVTAGAKQALFNACFTLFGPGDEVMVASPYWTSYPQIVSLAQADPIPVAGPEERDFRLGPKELEAARTPRTRGLIICSPSNPTGAVYSLEELRAVAGWAREHGVWLISDEIYRRIHFGSEEGSPAPGLLDLDPSEVGPFVLVDGVSKAYAMTGWRIGYTVSAPEVAKKFSALQSHTTSNAAAPSQYAALRALSERDRADAEIRGMVKIFRRRRDLVIRLCRERLPEFKVLEPGGAFYVFIRVDGDYGDGVNGSQEWCARILEETGVALVPGAAFGDDRFVRLSYATSDAMLEEAMRRLGESRTEKRGGAPVEARG